ncbi:MAG TPA: GNAT family N-acetyltransferase [Bryobacteraceae bacterium]|jgi:GNAT superfamily N-acetyltransferase
MTPAIVSKELDGPIEIRRLSIAEARERVSALAAVLVDCVEGGASVSFMWPFTQRDAEAFFHKVVESVAAGDRMLLAAFAEGKLVGTVQILTATPPNQPHRADIAKLLVLRSERGKGVGSLLMGQVEREAKSAGKTLLVLDTVTGGDAERLYARLGWVRGCVIPHYALLPNGRFCDTTIFWKEI